MPVRPVMEPLAVMVPLAAMLKTPPALPPLAVTARRCALCPAAPTMDDGVVPAASEVRVVAPVSEEVPATVREPRVPTPVMLLKEPAVRSLLLMSEEERRPLLLR